MDALLSDNWLNYAIIHTKLFWYCVSQYNGFMNSKYCFYFSCFTGKTSPQIWLLFKDSYLGSNLWQFGITENFKQGSNIIKFKKITFRSRKTIFEEISIVPWRYCLVLKWQDLVLCLTEHTNDQNVQDSVMGLDIRQYRTMIPERL